METCEESYAESISNFHNHNAYSPQEDYHLELDQVPSDSFTTKMYQQTNVDYYEHSKVSQNVRGLKDDMKIENIVDSVITNHVDDRLMQ